MTTLSPKFKQTEVGFIPIDWDAPSLDSVAKRGSGHTPDKKHPEYWNGDIKWISLRDSEALDKLFIEQTAASITQAGIANSSAVIHPAGTVVLSRDAGVGKSAIMKTSMAVSQHFMAWQCGPTLENTYLYYWLQSKKPELERVAMGSTIKTIGLPYFRTLKIPRPPLHEQKAIAAALVGTDALLSSLDGLIAKKRDLKEASAQRLLTGQFRLPGCSGAWIRTSLGSVAEIVMGQSPSSAFYNRKGDGLPLIQGNADIANRRAVKRVFTTHVTKRGRVGDTLLSVRAPVGEVSRTDFDVCLGRGVCAIRHKGNFLYHRLVAAETDWLKHSKGSTFDSINSAEISAFPIFVPEDAAEQDAIATVLSDIDAEIAAVEARRDKTLALKEGMMQQLLTGRIRLI